MSSKKEQAQPRRSTRKRGKNNESKNPMTNDVAIANPVNRASTSRKRKLATEHVELLPRTNVSLFL